MIFPRLRRSRDDGPRSQANTAPELPDDVPLDALESRLESGPAGLTSREATARLERFGPNETAEKRRHPLLELLGYFWAPIPWMIEIALALSLAVEHWADAGIIGALLLMNGLVSFVEEHQAAVAIAALKAHLAASARVLRDGQWTTVPARELVPGDVIRVRLGDVLPADARVLAGGGLQVDQSALTGESLPVERTAGDVLYSGAVMVRGEGDALVYGTGAASFMGRTTALVGEAGTTSHFQRAVLQIGDYLIGLAAILVAITLAVSLVRGNPVIQTLEFALVVTIASVPVALPAVLSVTMAIGARYLASRQAVVSHLPAVEELGSIDVLCSDKTGTLTQNRLAVGEPWMAPGVRRAELFRAAALASRAENRDPIDLAILAGTPSTDMAGAGRVIEFQPFDPVRKRTEAVVATEGNQRHVSKGAPQVITSLCSSDPAAASVEGVVNGFAARGFRSLAVAEQPDGGRWRLLGVLPLSDPPRDDSAATVAEARHLGIEVKMVTGDQAAIGREVAREVGLGDQLFDASALDDGDLENLAQRVEQADGFAQVFPEHKYRIVRLLQSRGHIVGMTGDGVNDAPALKQADAGIAVAGATDAARAAADVVLLAPGLSVIIDAVKTARSTFARMNSYAIYRTAETIRVLGVVVLAVVAFNFFPVTATMIVLLAILNDGAILSIAYDNARPSQNPAAWNMREMLGIAIPIGMLGVAETFLLFVLADKVFDLNRDVIQTLIYLKLSVSGHLTIFVTRSAGPFWSRPSPSRLLLGAVIGTQMIATLIAVYGLFMNPLGWGWAGAVWGFAVFWFFIEDRSKLAAYRVLRGPAGAQHPVRAR